MFVQGKVEKLTRHGTRAEMVMRSVSIIFPDGHVTNIGGPMTIESEEGTAWINPGTSTKAGVVAAPLVGVGLGAAIGAAAHTTQTTNFAGMTMSTSTPKGIAIGSMVGLAAGSIVSLVLLARSHHFYMATGSELDMALPQAVTLAQGQRVSRQFPLTLPLSMDFKFRVRRHDRPFRWYFRVARERRPGTSSNPDTFAQDCCEKELPAILRKAIRISAQRYNRRAGRGAQECSRRPWR
jgi:hypothetical protein